MSDNLDTPIAAALAALAQAEAEQDATYAAWQLACHRAEQVAADHAADLLHDLDVHIGDEIVLYDGAGPARQHKQRALLVAAAAFCWQGDDIPEMAQHVGIALTVRVALAGGRFSRRTQRRNMWLPPLPRGLRIAGAGGDDFQEPTP